MIKPEVHSQRIMFTLSPEDVRLIDILSEKLGETRSQVIKRAVVILAILHDERKFDLDFIA